MIHDYIVKLFDCFCVINAMEIHAFTFFMFFFVCFFQMIDLDFYLMI